MESNLINLQLGDIIKIYAPKNDILHEKIVYIKYISLDEINIINNKTKETLLIKDNKLTDHSINEIELLFRHPHKEYTKQHNLNEKTWVNVHFGGSEPFILIGQIVHIEGDCIEIQKYPTNEIYYINFDYKGLPKWMNINKIEIRETSPIDDKNKLGTSTDVKRKEKTEDEKTEDEKTEDEKTEDENPEDEKPEDEMDEEINNSIEDEFIQESDYDNDLDETLNMDNILKKTNDFVILDDLDSITQVVNVSESEKRFGIDIQTNDLFNTLLLNNDSKRNKTMNNIHNIVRRFTELRKEYSDFDDNLNPIKPDLKGPGHGADHKPIIDNLKNSTQNLKWIIPIIRRNKKIYNESENYDDIITYDNLDSHRTIIEEGSDLDNYRNRLVSNEDNIYYSHLRLIDNIFSLNVNDYPEQLYKTSVTNNREAIVNNHGNFLSTTIKNNVLNDETKYVLETYCLALDYLKEEDSNTVSLNNKYTRKRGIDEIMNIESYLTLPLQIFEYSRLYLKKSNILDKSNLSLINLQMHKLFKSEQLNQELIDDLDNDEELSVIYNGKNTNNILKTFNNFIFTSESENYNKNFEKYLQKIIPKTKKAFHMLTENMKNVYNYNDILLHLEPLLIYNKDISFKQYINFIIFIRKQVNNYNSKMNEESLILNKYQNNYEKIMKRHTHYVTGNIINNELNEKIKQMFNFNQYNVDTNTDTTETTDQDTDDVVAKTFSENVKLLIDCDSGNYLFYSLSKENVHLLSSTNINKALNFFNEKYKKTNDNDENHCKNYELSKKYYSEEDVGKDNNKQLFFDKEYDNTVYDILDVYKEERKKRDPSDYKIYLKNKLREINNISEDDAEYYMETLLRGKKEIKNGHYAIYSYNDDSFETLYKYYKRDNNEWIFDAKLTEDRKEELGMDYDENNCNSDKSCIQTNDDYFKIKNSFEKKNEAQLAHTKVAQNNSQCIDIHDDALKHEQKIIDRMISEYDHAHYLNKEKKEEFINEKHKYHSMLYQKLKELKIKDHYKYENYKNQLGALYNPLSEIVPSPFQNILDNILSENDDSSRYEYILRFSKNFTREATINENPYWNYCIETNVELLPTFMIKIASDFKKNGYVSMELLLYLCKTQGEKSDDGDSFVDRESGKVIMLNIKNDDEEYDDKNYKITREDIDKGNDTSEQENIDIAGEKELDYEMVTELSEDYMKNKDDQTNIIIEKIFLEGTIKYVSSIYDIFVNFVKIAINDEIKKFIIFHTNSIYISNFSSQNNEDISDKNKIILIFIFLSVFLIGTQIQNAKLKKTYPACVGNFEGYPLIQTADHHGISYLACFVVDVSKSKKKNNPFYLLNKSSQELIEKNIKEVLTKYTLLNSSVNTKILKRRDELEKQKMVPIEMKMSNWSKFKPPLFPYKIKIVKNFTEQSMKDMRKKIESKDEKGLIYFNQIKSKVYELSIIAHNIINSIISKQILTLKSNMYFEPFLENSCCETLDNNNVIDYFNNNDASLIPYVNMIKTNSLILQKYSSLLKAKISYLKPTQVTMPVLEFTNFDEKTIYTSFIHYCKWSKENNNLILKSDLLSICELSEEIFKPTDELDIKISKLKDAGKKYDNKMLLVLLKRIHNSNKVNIDFNNLNESNIDMFINYLTSIEDDNSDFNAIRDNILELTNTFDISMNKDKIFKENIILRRTLIDTNNSYIKDITTFLKTYGTLKSVKYNNIVKFLKNINTSDIDTKTKNNDIYINLITNLRSNITNFVNVYSNIIINQLDYYLDEKSSIPKHWGLTKTHNSLIFEVQSNFYKQFTSFYNSPHLNNILLNLKENGTYINHLSILTPTYLEQNKNIISVLDGGTIILIFVYYVLKVLHLLIDKLDEELKTDTDILVLKEQVASLLVNYIQILMNSFEDVLIDSDMIMTKILSSKEKEKMKIIDKLENLTDEQREVENELKEARLGNWSKGLDKALIVHDGNVFDAEVAEQTDVYIMADENERTDISHLGGDEEETHDDF